MPEKQPITSSVLALPIALIVMVSPRTRFFGSGRLFGCEIVAIVKSPCGVETRLYSLVCQCSYICWLFVKLQEHFFERCLLGLQADHLMLTEGLNQWVHAATHIELVVVIGPFYRAHTGDV